LLHATVSGNFNAAPNDVDYYIFFLPYKATVTFNDTKTSSTGSILVNQLKYYLYDYDFLTLSHIYSYTSLRAGVELESGFYYIKVPEVYNLGALGYTFTINYNEKGIVYKNVITEKMNNTSVLVWENSMNLQGSPFAANNLEPFYDYYGMDITLLATNEFLYKRIYFMNSEVSDYFKEALQNTNDLLNHYYDEYIDDMEELEYYVDLVSDIFTFTSKAGMVAEKIGIPEGALVKGISDMTLRAISLYEDTMSSYYEFILLTNFKNLLLKDATGSFVYDYLGNAVIDATKLDYYLKLNYDVYSTLISTFNYSPVIEFLDLAEDLTDDFGDLTYEPDDLAYVDIMGRYYVDINDTIQVDQFTFRDTDDSDYLAHLEGSEELEPYFYNYTQSGEEAQGWKLLSNMITLPVGIPVGISTKTYTGDFVAYANADPVTSSTGVFSIKLPSNIKQDLISYSVPVGGYVSSTTLLNNVYSYNSLFGFVAVQVDRSLVNFNAVGTYRVEYFYILPNTLNSRVHLAYTYIRVYSTVDDPILVEM